eukprot:1161728-Pelagomonas_calceolata.AAC.7
MDAWIPYLKGGQIHAGQDAWLPIFKHFRPDQCSVSHRHSRPPIDKGTSTLHSTHKHYQPSFHTGISALIVAACHTDIPALQFTKELPPFISRISVTDLHSTQALPP